MPLLLLDNEDNSMNRRRRHPMRNKKGKKRRHRQPITERIGRNSHRAAPSVEEVEPQQLLTENDVFVDLANLDGENIAHCFMTKDDNDPKLEGQAKTVVLFYHPDALSELSSNSPELSLKKMCLIDDRTCQGSTSKALGVCEPLTVYEMFKKLQRKVSDIW
ncbi:hypothetical protein FSPOR_5871 [Fusarium sporotrichioides]|uniref:Uncharacterized protein n=1 Tax=Fusarium sporotrichioides TaxID=5514 RepID=A0A395S5N3_FUSSP|nr:hypothetical protein FSPOR_5871 [Fusarium sporotrichioides]